MLGERVDIGLVKFFESRILGFCRNWISSSDIEQAVINENGYPCGFCLLPLSSPDIIQPDSISGTFTKSADEVFIAACFHYLEDYAYHAGKS